MRRFLVLWLLSAVAGGAFAADDALSVPAAVNEALAHNLDLLARKLDVPIADAAVVTAGLKPNPLFSAGADHLDLLGTGFDSTNQAGPSEYALRVDFIDQRGKRGRRVAVARSERDAAFFTLADRVRTLALDVQNAAVEVQNAHAARALAGDTLALMERTVRIIGDRVRAGDLAPVDLARSQVAALTAQNAVLSADSRLRVAQTKLRVLVGRSAGGVADVAGAPREEAPPTDRAATLAAALARRPDLLAARADLARARADLALQDATGEHPDLTFGTEARRQQGTAGRGNALGFFVNVPLTIHDRNQGERQRARHAIEKAQKTVAALENDISGEVAQAFQELETARGVLDTIERSMLAPARQVRETMEYSYRRGEASLVEFLDAARAFNDTTQTYNDARAEYARGLYKIEAIAGRSPTP